VIDIIVTTYNRLHFLQSTLESLLDSVTSELFKLYIIDDCSFDGTREYLSKMNKFLDISIILSDERRGVVPNFNSLWDTVILNERHPFLCYLQDDIVAVEKDWLTVLTVAWHEMKDAYKIGFLSGYDAPEHPTEREIMWMGRNVKIKKSTSGQNLFADKKFWASIGKPPELNFNGSVRGFPDNGKGSNIDVWFTGCYSLSKFDQKNAAPNCLYKQGKRVMVIPMLKHLGIEKKDSTWRQNRVGGF